MFCRNCGKEINDNSTFCPHCGKPVLGNKPNTNTNKQNGLSQVNAESVQALVQKMIKNKKILAIIGVILLIILLFARCGKDGGNSGGKSGGKNSLSSIEGHWEQNAETCDDYSFCYTAMYEIKITKEGIKGSGGGAEWAVSAKDVTIENVGGTDYYCLNGVMYNWNTFEKLNTRIGLYLQDDGKLKCEIFLEGGWHPVARYVKK